MQVNRRQFLVGGSAATVAVTLPGMAFAKVSGTPRTGKEIILDIISRRFPYVNLEDQGVSQFVEMILTRDVNYKGITGVSMAEALDSSNPEVTLDLVVGREFMLNTNFFWRDQKNFNGIIFKEAHDMDAALEAWSKEGFE